MSYDEEWDRVSRFAIATKEALPDVKILAPSPCSWWFCKRSYLLPHRTSANGCLDWTSSVGYTDNTAHGNVDFLPWFLGKMKDLEIKNRKRFLDYLDIHYYFQPDTSKEDEAAKALRLRMTRSLWVCFRFC